MLCVIAVLLGATVCVALWWHRRRVTTEPRYLGYPETRPRRPGKPERNPAAERRPSLRWKPGIGVNEEYSGFAHVVYAGSGAALPA